MIDRIRVLDRLVDYVSERWDPIQVLELTAVARNAARLRLRDGREYLLVCRRDGSIQQVEAVDF